MRIERLVRYPVKGMGPDFVSTTTVIAGGAMPFDREYAIAHAVTEFNPERPVYLRKHNFLMLMRNSRLAALQTTYDEAQRRADVVFPDGTAAGCRLDDEADREALADALAGHLGKECRGGRPKIVSAKDHRFFDVPEKYLSLINLTSVDDLGRFVGSSLDPIRFRANIYVSGMQPWEEVSLVGREFVCGDVRLRATRAIERCAATSVNPQTGEADVNVPVALRKGFDTRNMGLYLEVAKGGTLEVGRALTLVE